MEQLKITYSGLPGVYPDGFSDTIYIDNTRAVKTRIYEEEFNTAEKYTTTQDTNYRNLQVQNVAYDQYKIEVINKESQSYELLKSANNIVIYDSTQQKTYNAIIIDVITEDVFNSSFKKVTIEFYDTNIDNYIGVQPVIDHLKSDVVLRLYDILNLNYIKFTYLVGGVFNYLSFYSIINGELITLDSENDKTEELNGQNIATRFTIKKAIKSIYYVSGSDIQELKEKLILSTGIQSQITIINNSSTYNGYLERPTWTLEPVSNAVDLWKLDITMTYEINDITPYNI